MFNVDSSSKLAYFHQPKRRNATDPGRYILRPCRQVRWRYASARIWAFPLHSCPLMTSPPHWHKLLRRLGGHVAHSHALGTALRTAVRIAGHCPCLRLLPRHKSIRKHIGSDTGTDKSGFAAHSRRDTVWGIASIAQRSDSAKHEQQLFGSLAATVLLQQ